MIGHFFNHAINVKVTRLAMLRSWSVCNATSREAREAIGRHSGKGAAFAFLIFAPTMVSAQSKSTPISLSEYQKQEWHVEDGLPQGNVRAITQAPDRALMIGTSEGVATFDGIRFTPFPLHTPNGPKNEPVNAILYSRSGELWIGTDDRGVLVQRGQTVVAISEDSGFHGERIRALHEDHRGIIWAATQNGIEKIHDGKIEALYSMGRAEFFNAFNRPQLGNPDSTITSFDPSNLGSFGNITNTVADNRDIQFGLKLVF
jgi:Two component regulator propeller